MKDINKQIEEAIRLKEWIHKDAAVQKTLYQSVQLMTNCFRAGGKVLFCGNGGSAADAQHLAAELSGRFYLDRPPLAAEALHVNTSFITATANDDSFDRVYQRMLQALGREGDILVAFSTSGRSVNVLNALSHAKESGIACIGFCGKHTDAMAPYCDALFSVPSSDTPRIQEMHLFIGHLLCELTEAEMFASE